MSLVKLRQALLTNDQSAIKTSLAMGADPFEVENDGLDAFDYAKRFSSEDTFNLLIALSAASENTENSNSYAYEKPGKGSRGKARAFESEITIEEFETENYLDDSNEEIETVIKQAVKRNPQDPRNDDYDDYDYEKEQDFGIEANIDDDDSIVFAADTPALAEDVDVEDAYDQCEKHFSDLHENAKRLLSIYIYSSGGDASLFLRFSERTESHLRQLKKLHPDFIGNLLTELEGCFDQSIQELFCLLATDKNRIPINRKELTVALFLDVAKKIYERNQIT
jgi:hypothetical protein